MSNVVVTWTNDGLRPTASPHSQVFRGYHVVRHGADVLVLESPRGKTTIPMKHVLYWEERT